RWMPISWRTRRWTNLVGFCVECAWRTLRPQAACSSCSWATRSHHAVSSSSTRPISFRGNLSTPEAGSYHRLTDGTDHTVDQLSGCIALRRRLRKLAHRAVGSDRIGRLPSDPGNSEPVFSFEERVRTHTTG